MSPLRTSLALLLVVSGCHVVAGLADLEVGDDDGDDVGGGGQGATSATVSASGGLGGSGGMASSVAGTGAGTDVGGGGQCCVETGVQGCPTSPVCQTCVCACDAYCCTNVWDANCALVAASSCAMQCGCDPGPQVPCI